MSIVLAIHLIEGIIIVSDSRYTKTISSKIIKFSDTAPKLFQLSEQQIVGIVGNPFQANKLIENLKKKAKKDKVKLSPKYILQNIFFISEETTLVNKGDPNCILIFAGVELSERKEIKIKTLRKFWLKNKESFFKNWNRETAKLIKKYLKDKNCEGKLIFHTPATYLFSFHFLGKKIRHIKILDYGVWGSEFKATKKRIKKELFELWTADFKRNNVKPLIAALSVLRNIKESKTKKIGGFPQSFYIDFHGKINHSGLMKIAGEHNKINTGIKFKNKAWIQIKENGKVIKIKKTLSDKPKYTKEEKYFD